MHLFQRIWRDNDDATAIEYGLIVALIAIGIITAMQGFGNELQTTFNTASSGVAGLNAAAA